jgi:hypothetical protein
MGRGGMQKSVVGIQTLEEQWAREGKLEHNENKMEHLWFSL